MIYYKVIHKYKLIDHYEIKDIGIFSSLFTAMAAIEDLKNKVGFKDTVYGFKIKKVIRLFKPKLIDHVFWIDGFETYTYVK